jgi:hypothetical protein
LFTLSSAAGRSSVEGAPKRPSEGPVLGAKIVARLALIVYHVISKPKVGINVHSTHIAVLFSSILRIISVSDRQLANMVVVQLANDNLLVANCH